MIPKEFHGLPVHALAVHAAVVMVPLAALLAVLFVVPQTRRWAALPMAIVSVGAFLSVWVARASGFNLKSQIESFSGSATEFNNSAIGKAILDHEGKANVLFYLLIPYTIIAVVVYLMWLRPSWWPSQASLTGNLQYVACAVLIVGAVIVAVQTARVGEAGAKAVWNPDGSQSYSMGVVSVLS